MTIWSNYQKPFVTGPFQFKLFELWREAIKKCDYKIWSALLFADLIFIVISNTPIWMHQLGLWFPGLKMFQINPPWMQTDLVLVKFAAISKALLPIFLFPLFISMPLFLGMMLYVLRLAYNRPVNLSVLRHYFRLYWWCQLSALAAVLFMLAGLVIAPFYYVITAVLKAQAAHHAAYTGQLYGSMALLFIAVFIFATFFSMGCFLIFAARIHMVNAFKMSYRATKTHFWRFAAMILISYVTVRLRVMSYYLTDILLMPPAMMAWALLYKRIYGEAGLIE